MRTMLLIGAMTVLGGVGCTQDPQIARYTVQEYRADAVLRREVFARCTNDPGTHGDSADCVNAIEAERLESRGSLRDAPTIGLDADGPR